MKDGNNIIEGGHFTISPLTVVVDPCQSGVENIFFYGAVENKGTLGHEPDIINHIFFGKLGNFAVSDHDTAAGVFI